MKKWILTKTPIFVQNIAISVFNSYLYRQRHAGAYKYFKEYFRKFDGADEQLWLSESSRRLSEFLSYATENSRWYKQYRGLSLHEFPILEKRDILENLEEISTVSEKKGIVSLTGGTTGASMKVIYTKEGMQEKFALLDHFRGLHGYSLGKRTAWFSGKEIVRDSDINRGICYRDDYINRIRFFSTFYITEKNFDIYWESIREFSPEYIVGFPSSVFELCSIAKARGLLLKGVVKAFFPTAEVVSASHRQVITGVLGCQILDQYSSSEGAPFILECSHGSLHIQPLTGIFEVVDQNMNPSKEGELLVTSFHTKGTPLIRYRIGDRLTMSPEGAVCSCGSTFPMVSSIDGRSLDFIYSTERGRVNLGNISNCTKDVDGIHCFQVIQEVENMVSVKIVSSPIFDDLEKEKFLKALRARLGHSMEIELLLVDDIPVEKSGKFRIVKNSLKSILN